MYMAIYDQDEQVSMADGDDWYFDEFGEYRNANASQLEEEDLQTEAMVPDEFGETTTSTSSDLSGDTQVDDEFNETLSSEYIDDQLDDPNLQQEAESDYQNNEDQSLGSKIKEKFNDLTGM
jgi:hypothetical protein